MKYQQSVTNQKTKRKKNKKQKFQTKQQRELVIQSLKDFQEKTSAEILQSSASIKIPIESASKHTP
jgi:serine/threonine protein phosphatase PrpC